MNEIYNQFLEILTTGDTHHMEQFLEQHLKDLPEDFQEKIIFALFEDATKKQLLQEELLQQTQQEGFDLLKKLEKAKQDFEEVQKIAEIKSQLAQ